MVETSQESDFGKGVVLTLSAIATLGAIAVAGSAYLSAIADDGATMQLYSGIFMTVALLAAGIAVAAVHLYD